MKSVIRVALLACLLSAIALTANANELFRARLLGSQEVPPVATSTFGDAIFRLRSREQSIDFQLIVRRGVNILQAHIHCAPVGQNGPVVIFLAGLLPGNGHDINGRWIGGATFDSGAIINEACGSTIAELAQAMRAGQTYVNVHSVAHPAGVIRGQIRPTR